MRTCISCKHYSVDRPFLQVLQNPQDAGPYCKNENASSRDPVFGLAYCRVERQGGKGCGKGGKLWEPQADKA